MVGTVVVVLVVLVDVVVMAVLEDVLVGGCPTTTAPVDGGVATVEPGVAGTGIGTVVPGVVTTGAVIVGSPSRGGTARCRASGPKLETTRITTPITDAPAT